MKKYGYAYYFNSPEFKQKLHSKWTAEALMRYDLNLIGCELVGETTLRCKTCGYEKNIVHAQREAVLSFCPNCHKNLRSKFEFLIAEHLKQLNVEFISNDRAVIGPKELDIYVPKFKLAIEIDGLYFHQNKPKRYHLDKTEECLSKGIKLLHLTDKTLLEHKNIALSIIDSFLGKTESIPARKCEVRQLTTEEYSNFCNANHLQGTAPAKVKLGLFHNGELVQLESFSKPRFSSKYQWELVRECSKLGVRVIGGKSKLFKHFLKDYNPESIISYCDRSLFTGSSYETIGMTFLYATPPSYSYYKSGQLLSRYQCQKHRLKELKNFKFDSSLTERENMLANGYGIVYDCGANVYIWQREIESGD